MLLLLAAVFSMPNGWSTLAAFSLVFGVTEDVEELKRPHKGEEVLPKQVLEIIEIVRTRDLHDFMLGPKLKASNETFQRVTEGAWPARLTSSSVHRFFLQGESISTACHLVDVRTEVVYADCD